MTFISNAQSLTASSTTRNAQTTGRWARRMLPICLRTAASMLAAVLSFMTFSAAQAQFTPLNTITTVSGNGTAGYAGNGGSALAAAINKPKGLAFDNAGNLYITDAANNVVRKVSAATGIITTVAGVGTAGYSGDGGPAIAAQLFNPTSVAVDSVGNIYIADLQNSVIRKVSATTGNISTFAGNNTSGNSGDGGQATSAGLEVPQSIALDSNNNLYIASNSEVRKVSAATGVISTYAGNGNSGFTGDGGAATSASFYNAVGVAVDGANNIYVADYGNNRIRKITAATGIIATVAGTGMQADTGDNGPAISASLNLPVGLTVDATGNVYILVSNDDTVRMITAATGVITTIVGNGSSGFSGDDGLPTSAQLFNPYSAAIDPSGLLYVSDTQNNRIRRVGPVSFPTTAIGSSIVRHLFLQSNASQTIAAPKAAASSGGTQEYTPGAVTGCTTDGVTVNAAGSICNITLTFSPAYPGTRPVPLSIVTSKGVYYMGLAGIGSGPLGAFTPGIITTVAGNGTPGSGGSGGPATSAMIDVSQSYLTVDSAGNLYFDDSSCIVRKVTAANGIISVVAGNGLCSGSAVDGGSPTATPLHAFGIVIDSAGNIYIADAAHYTVRKIAATTGTISTIAGTSGMQGSSGDGGPATAAKLYAPVGLALDSFGNLYISDNHVIRKLSTAGIISTVAGNGNPGSTGDGGPATSATLSGPSGLAFDGSNDLFIADQLTATIREVSATTGIISTVAGNGVHGYTGDGHAATAAELNQPTEIALDAAANLYLVDSLALVVRKVEAATGTISTIAGYGQSVGGIPPRLDGNAATSEYLSTPYGVALDGAGNVFINASTVIRKVNVSTSTLIYPTATNVGMADSTDNPKTAFLSDIGNTTLSITPPAAGSNPDISAGWTLDTAATCPRLSATSSPFNIAAGTSCTYALDFTPAAPGINNGTLTLADNSLNTATTQYVALNGSGVGTSATVTLTPGTLTFSSNAGVMPATQDFTITNTGTMQVSLGYPQITGPDAASFRNNGTNCGFSLNAGTSCSITIAFTASIVGSYSASLSLSDSGTPSTLTGGLVGIVSALPGSATLTPPSLSFTANVGATSAIQTATLTNTGSSTLTISSVGLSGTITNFYIPMNNCGATLDPGKSCTVGVSFSPMTPGTFTAMLVIVDSYATQTVALTGTVTAPQAALTPATLALTAPAGGSSTPQTATLTNAGTAPLAITSVTLGGTDVALFSLSKTCGTSLAAGASCTATITFKPLTGGTFTATLTVVDSVGTQTSILTGTSLSATTVTVAPATITFPTTAPHSALVTQNITVTATGSAALTFNSITLSGANASEFTLLSFCNAPVASGANCLITIGFQPLGKTQHPVATLTIIDNVGTQTVPITGSTNADFAISSIYDIDSDPGGTNYNGTFSISSVDPNVPFTDPITFSGAPTAYTFRFDPTTVSNLGTKTTGVTVYLSGNGLGRIQRHQRPGHQIPEVLFCGLMGLGFLFRKKLRGRALAPLLSIALLLGAMSLTGCFLDEYVGSAQITATSGTIQHTFTMNIFEE